MDLGVGLWGEFEIVRSGTFTLDIERETVPNLCEALEDVVAERYGVHYYVPRFAADSNSCRYDWPLRFHQDPFGLRLTLAVDVRAEDVGIATLNLSLGPNFLGRLDLIDKRVANRAVKEINDVIDSAFGVLAFIKQP